MPSERVSLYRIRGGIAAVGRGVDGAPGGSRCPAVDRRSLEVSERGKGVRGRMAGPARVGRRRARAARVWRGGMPAVEVRDAGVRGDPPGAEAPSTRNAAAAVG